MYKLYIFDMGNVVIKDITTLDKIAGAYRLDYDELLADYLRWGYPMGEGEVDTMLYWRHFERKYQKRVDEDLFATYFTPSLNHPVVSLIRKLRESGKRVVCGSNTFGCHWEIIRELGALDIFDALYPSHEIHFMKPDCAFFRHILEAEGVEGSECAFVDDIAANRESARRMGIDAFAYMPGDDITELTKALF